MRAIRLASILLLSSFPSYAASGGVFCQGTMSFIARPEQSGALAFKLTGSTQQQNIIEVGGIASPHAEGWRYQIKSVSTPADRCTVDIKGNGGGYYLKTVEGARCESLGGIGASALIESAAFPAASRVPGAVPPGGKPDDFPAFDCRHKRFFSSNEAAVACAGPVLGAAPIGVVRELIAQYRYGYGSIFADKPTAIMKQYFTDGFNASWTKAMSHNQEEPVLDGDPITGYQMMEHVDWLSTIGGETSPTTAKVVANLKVTAGSQTKPEQVTFSLKLENRRWKIDDMTSGNTPSIRSYFRKSYGA